jgi:WD40 repeat protein
VAVSGGWDGTVRAWDLSTGEPRGEPLRGHEGGVRSVALGELEGAGGGDQRRQRRTVRVWDLSTGESRHMIEVDQSVTGVAMRADGYVMAMAVAGAHGLLRLDVRPQR